MNTGVSRSKIFGVGEYPSGTFRFKKIDGSFWNGETFRFADYIGYIGRNTLPIYLFHPIFTMGGKLALPLFHFDNSGGTYDLHYCR